MKNRQLKRLWISSGEPAGIGPDLCLLLAQKPVDSCSADHDVAITVLGDKHLLQQRAQQLGLVVDIIDVTQHAPECLMHRGNGRLLVKHLPLKKPVLAGHPDVANAAYVLQQLDWAVQACRQKQADALVTAPVQKSLINQAGYAFSGHTEYLRDSTHSAYTLMMLANNTMRVVLATTHLPLKDVPSAITQTLLSQVIQRTVDNLITKFAILQPRITLAGLNPHAGENGYLGTEEQEVMIPVIHSWKLSPLAHVRGPVAADTMFVTHLADTDCFIAMYHDQGLAVIKYADFAATVNITLGLPFIRTSVDHGTALELAGTGRADPSSLFAAVDYAVRLTPS